MSLEVVHAQESHAVAGPSPMAKGFELNAPVSQPLPAVQDQTLLPCSQESQHSATSKHTGLSSSVEAVSDRQLTPTSSQSGNEQSSPQQPPAYLTSPQASGALPSYESLAAYEPSDEGVQSPVSVGRPSSYYVDQTAGQKRTASGALKASRAGSAESGGQDGQKQRSRTTSTVSRSSQVGELTSQLRARLAYAKVKVQHGWESRTLDEIETITSIPTSPASVKTHSTRAYQSPRSGRPLHNGERAGYMQTDRPVTAPSRQLNYGQAPNGHAEPGQHGHTTPMIGNPPPPPSRGSLAPPVDFSHPRRSPNGTHSIPPLVTTGSHGNVSASSSSSRSQFPSTPPIYPPAYPPAERPSASHKTPSQRTMEQDAIETLLFMSSPGNSGTFARPPPVPQHPHHQHQQAVANGAFYGHHQLPNGGSNLHGKPGFPPPRQIPRPDVDSIPVSPRRRDVEEKVLGGANLHDSQGIDSALDEMRRRAVVDGETGESSDEDE